MPFSTQVLATGLNRVEPRIAVGEGVAVAWASDGISLARESGGAWETRKIRSEPCAGVRMAMGPNGRVWAAWDAGGKLHQGISIHPSGVRIEVGASDDFAPEIVVEGLWSYCYGASWDLAIGPDGEPRVAWCFEDRIFVGTRSNGRWTVNEGPQAERDWVRLAVDSKGNTHLLYQRDFHLLYDDIVVGGKYETGHASLVLDADDRPHVPFMGHTKTKDHLVHARLDGGVFQAEVADKKGNCGFGSRVALRDGGPIIGHRSEHSRDGASTRRVAPVEHRITSKANGKWITEVVDTGGAASDFALASDGTAWAVFLSTTEGNLSIATSGPLSRPA